jgi:hypothetical protein
MALTRNIPSTSPPANPQLCHWSHCVPWDCCEIVHLGPIACTTLRALRVYAMRESFIFDTKIHSQTPTMQATGQHFAPCVFDRHATIDTEKRALFQPHCLAQSTSLLPFSFLFPSVRVINEPLRDMENIILAHRVDLSEQPALPQPV